MARQAPVLRDLSTGRVSEAMRPAPMPISTETTLLLALDSHLRADRQTDFPVVDPDGRVVGTLSFGSAAKVGGDDPTRRADEAMTPWQRIWCHRTCRSTGRSRRSPGAGRRWSSTPTGDSSVV